ncbi:conserved hypothetical protein [Verrucomicrobia bacterium]|nr:conserved hypothetical protein [Verrucomicrobiota bacterium]
MAWFKKKADPISDRTRALNQEIADLEAQIKRLGAGLANDSAQPRWRSTVVPQGVLGNQSIPSPRGVEETPATAATAANEPIFEPVDQDLLKANPEKAATPEHFNELGVRKYDLPALVRRLRSHFRGPSTTNPKLVSYLAAGGIQGLRPMRYEKRVARNRFIALALFLFLTLLGCLAVFIHGR